MRCPHSPTLPLHALQTDNVLECLITVLAPVKAADGAVTPLADDVAATALPILQQTAVVPILRGLLLEGEHLAAEQPALYRRAVAVVRMFAVTPAFARLLRRSSDDDGTPLAEVLRDQHALLASDLDVDVTSTCASTAVRADLVAYMAATLERCATALERCAASLVDAAPVCGAGCAVGAGAGAGAASSDDEVDAAKVGTGSHRPDAH